VAPIPDTEVSGRDLVTGGLRRVRLTAEEVRDALQRPLSQIVDMVKQTLEATPPELAADISNRGIVLVGGGSLLRGLDELMRSETQLPVHLADSPLTCVAIGAGKSLEELSTIQQIGRPGRTSRRRRRRAT
jgi:rod shape-determining protein MreB